MIYYLYMTISKSVRKEIGTNIKAIRDKKGLIQEDVAKMAGMKANYYAKIERGTIGTAPEKLDSIIKALKVKASDVFPS